MASSHSNNGKEQSSIYQSNHRLNVYSNRPRQWNFFWPSYTSRKTLHPDTESNDDNLSYVPWKRNFRWSNFNSRDSLSRQSEYKNQGKETGDDCKCWHVILVFAILLIALVIIITVLLALFLIPETKPATETNAAQPAIVTLRNVFTNMNLSRTATYSIFVSTSGSRHMKFDENYTWAYVQGLDPQPPYVAINKCADLYTHGNNCPSKTRSKRQTITESINIAIGLDNNCDRKAIIVYCNGPLAPDTEYFVSVRAHDGDVYYDSPFSEPIKTLSLESVGEWQSWGSWGLCDVTCGGGTQRRHRQCQQATSCIGMSSQTQMCGVYTCLHAAATEYMSTTKLTDKATTEYMVTPKLTDKATTEYMVTPKLTDKATTEYMVTPKLTDKAATEYMSTTKLTDKAATEYMSTTKLTDKATTEYMVTPKLTDKAATEYMSTTKLTDKATTEYMVTPKLTDKATTEYMVTPKLTDKATTEYMVTPKLTDKAATEYMSTTKLTDKATTEYMVTPKLTDKATTEYMVTRKLTDIAATEYMSTTKLTDKATTEYMVTTTLTDKDAVTPEAIVPNSMTATANSFVVTLNNIFTSLSSNAQYSILVRTILNGSHLKETYPNNTRLNDSYTWALAQGVKPHPEYVAIYKCANLFTHGTACPTTTRTKRSYTGQDDTPESINITLGQDVTCDKTSVDRYCNGPLEPNSVYYIKLRAYDGGSYYDSQYSAPIKTAALGKWLSWGPWSQCDVSCGGGIQRRERQCQQGFSCMGLLSETQGCNSQKCPRTNNYGTWSTWTGWSECSVTCGGGIRNRTRSCNRGPQNYTCIGISAQQLNCSHGRCADCTYTCQNGNLVQPACTHCECNAEPIQGKVASTEELSLHQVEISLHEVYNVVLNITGPNGNFSLHKVCPGQSIRFQKAGYTSKVILADNIPNVVFLESEVPLMMDIHPTSKKRLIGDDVLFCCSASGNPLPTYYEWFKDGVEIISERGNMLLLSNVQLNSTGIYRCRANTESNAKYSTEATLTVKGNADDFCPNQPISKYIKLPEGCGTNNSLQYDIKQCGDQRCRGQSVINNTCNEELTYCCAAAKYEKVVLECAGFNYTLYKVEECGCFECVDPVIEIKGLVLEAENRTPLQNISIYYNKSSIATTNSEGQFYIQIFTGTVRVSITAKPMKGLEYGESTSVLVMNEGSNGIFYTVITLGKVKRLPPIDSTVDNILSIEGNSEELMSVIIPSNSIFDEEGYLYEGIVSPIVSVIDPKQNASLESAPGDFTTIDAEGEEQTLQTYGMFSLSLYDDEGKKLQIPNQVEIDIPAHVLGNTSTVYNQVQNIKLFKFDDQGQWDIQETLTKPSQRRRKKRQAPVYTVNIPGIRISNEWYNFDAVATTICYSKIRVYEDDNFEISQQKTKAQVYAIVEGNDGTHSLSRVRPVGDDDNNGYCVVHRCDSPRNNLYLGFKGYLFSQHNGKYLIPAKTNTGLDDLEYIAHEDRIEVSFDLNKAGSNGPFYDWESPKWMYSDKCVNAPPEDTHFRFHFHTEDQCYQEIDEFPNDPKIKLTDTCNPMFYPRWRSAIDHTLDDYDLCYIKVRVSSSSNLLRVKAASKVGTMQYGGSFTIGPGDTYGTREGCPIDKQLCLEVKRPGRRGCSNKIEDPEEKTDEFTEIEVSVTFIGSDIQQNVSWVNNKIMGEMEILQTDTFLRLKLIKDLSEDFGIYCTRKKDTLYKEKTKEEFFDHSFKECMRKEQHLVTFGENCENLQCMHAANCEKSPSGNKCICLPGYTGTYCSNEINECDNSPCQHGGQCWDKANSYTCTCSAGFTGVHCEIDIDECASSPCTNGSQCIDGSNKYVCHCAQGFGGIDCNFTLNGADLYSNCSASTEITSLPAVITSPNYPLSFNSAYSCNWMVKSNSTIYLYFLDMYLETNVDVPEYSTDISSQCHFDYIQFFDMIQNATLNGKYCGDIGSGIPPVTIQSGNLRIYFETDTAYNDYRGFQLYVTDLPE